jgi:outer membrane lipoprotein-sorting protein
MRSRLLIFVLVAVAAAAVVAGIVAVAGADQTGTLPSMSAQDLLATMAQQSHQARDISGEVAWHNGLLGQTPAASGAFGALPAQLPLVGDGSGRIWVGQGGARIESQGGSGDQVVVANTATHTTWVYDFSTSTAKKIVVTGVSGQEATPQPTPSSITPAMVATLLERLAPVASVQVTGQTALAGRDAYLLRLTPTATDTAVGYVQAAIDGKTYVPLQLQVVAKGATAPVLEFGFTSVSYDPIPAATFDFTPPAGTKVTTKTIDASKLSGLESATGGGLSDSQKVAAEQLVPKAFLTVPQARALVPFELVWARDYTARPFDWAVVLDQSGPLTATGDPLASLLGLDGALGGNATSGGPVAVLIYGKGFGSIVLAETKTTTALDRQIKSLPTMLGTSTMNGVTVHTLTTPLGGVYIWEQGGTTLVAGGLVSASDLQAFASSAR